MNVFVDKQYMLNGRPWAHVRVQSGRWAQVTYGQLVPSGESYTNASLKSALEELKEFVLQEAKKWEVMVNADL